MNEKDPWNIIGKEIKAADGGDYGHRILSYDTNTQDYTVRSIRWSTANSLKDETNTIDNFKISYRYLIDSARDLLKNYHT